jgi:hypothetical protein
LWRPTTSPSRRCCGACSSSRCSAVDDS